MARSFDQQLARKGIITVGVTKCSENLAPGGSDTDTGPNGWECTFQPDAQLRGDPLYDTGRSDNNAWIINVSINTTKRCWSAKSAGYGDTGRDDYGLENALGNPLTGCLVELDHPPKDPSPGH